MKRVLFKEKSFITVARVPKKKKKKALKRREGGLCEHADFCPKAIKRKYSSLSLGADFIFIFYYKSLSCICFTSSKV